MIRIMKVKKRAGYGAFVVILLFSHTASAANWPMWRYDAARTASTDHQLPEELHLLWTRQLRKPDPAWTEEQYKLQFDRSYEPVVMGKQIFVGSMVSDSVTAYDTETGAENWRYYCEGPVRFAPVASEARVWFASDDGCLYCLDSSGKLVWRKRLAPADDKMLGNGRLISTWPARGAPVLSDGKIYCAASIWPFMGIFIHAVDAVTGESVWQNSGSGSIYIDQPHNSPAFGGVAPQGYMAVQGDRLLIPSRTRPACYNRKTGELIYYNLSDRDQGKHVGGYAVSVWKKWFFNGDVLHRLTDGQAFVRSDAQVQMHDKIIAFDSAGDMVAYRPVETSQAERKKGQPPVKAKGLWKSSVSPRLDKIHCRAGNRLYGSNRDGLVAAVDIPEAGGKAEIIWKYKTDGAVWSMLAADDKLFAVSEDGVLYCFGRQKETVEQFEPEYSEFFVSEGDRRRALRILDETGISRGYCILAGIGDGSLLKAIIAESKLQVIGIDQDVRKVDLLRREMDAAGLYGTRVALLAGDLEDCMLPPYMANLFIVEDAVSYGVGRRKNVLDNVYRTLRPYGGQAWLGASGLHKIRLEQRVRDLEFPGAASKTRDDWVCIEKPGPLPGSGSWTGQYGDAGNTVCSQDDLRLPLGVLWFGDDSDFLDVLPRHGHGPPEQVVAGRLFIEGVNSFSARDVYTGSILWETTIDDSDTFDIYHDDSFVRDYRDTSYNQLHLPGANTRGTNFIAAADKVYIVQGASCRVIDAGSGRDINRFSLPVIDGHKPEEWAYINIYGDILLAGADYASYLSLLGDRKLMDKYRGLDKGASAGWADVFEKAGSRRLVAMNRHSGKVLWTIDSRIGFIHNGIAAGNGRIYCLDGMPPYIRKVVTENKDSSAAAERILAVDAETGEILWQKNEGVFGSWLSYSKKHDVLLEAQRRSRDMVWEPGDEIAALQGSTGKELWYKSVSYNGPCMLVGDRVITQGKAFDLLTGETHMRKHPISNEMIEWSYSRNYGCNTAIASRNMLTFRSAAAGFYDLANNGGTGNLGGFKSGCTTNLVVADGVLNAPEYTRTCTCSYQNQTSLAMIHSPAAEMWTFNRIKAATEPITRLGINFGAPGDRVADNGTLWLDYPSVGGPSPAVQVKLQPAKPTAFRKHSSLVKADGLRWVAASGLLGVRQVTVRLIPQDANTSQQKPLNYTVTLHFLDPRENAKTESVFDVIINGEKMLKKFNPVEAAGSTDKGIFRSFKNVTTTESVEIKLEPEDAQAETFLCGIEFILQQ